MSPQASAPAAAPAMPEAFPRSREGLEDRVSTRIPTSTKLTYDPHETNNLSINRAAMLPEGMGEHHVGPQHQARAQDALVDTLGKHADLIRNEYPFINTNGLGHAAVLERFIEHAHDNIVGLWKRVANEPWRDKAADWYRGANRLADDMGQRFGVTKRQAAAVIASLSPQKDWDQNVSLAERVLNTHKNHQDSKITPQMRDFMQKMVDARTDKTRAVLDIAVNGGKSNKTGQEFSPLKTGMSYRDLSHPMQKALFIRAMDEMHSPDRGYDIISPSGQRYRAKVGEGDQAKDATAAWGDLGSITNAVKAAESNDHLPSISRALGSMHKVRSFYNNIISPDAAAYLPKHHADLTADTHAINANLMLPLGGTHPLVQQGLGGGGSASNYTGAKGLYGLHADAYRRAADTISQLEGRRYLPREVQSVVWETIRNLWLAEHKKINKDTGEFMHPVGKAAHEAAVGGAYAVRHGFMPRDMAMDSVIQKAGGIRVPEWHRRMMEEQNV
jgi:hypothetical protein